METVDIIESIINEISATVIFKTVNKVGTSFEIESDCTQWLMNGMLFELSGTLFTVRDLKFNEGFTIKPSIDVVSIAETEITLTSPKYFHGTLKMVRNAITANTKKKEILPFIYLFEVINDRKVNDAESAIDRESELRLFFLGSADTKNWLTDSHYDNVIYPMSVLTRKFISIIKDSKFFTYIFDYDESNLINVSENGNQGKSIFDINLSGIEMRLFSEIRKDLSCNLINNNC